MNLEKLFKAQKALRDKINYNDPDRFDKSILALLVEIGELCQEWRGFKFWSEKQEPLTTCRECEGDGQSFVFAGTSNEHYKLCEVCKGEGEVNYLLEEYVDGLHIVIDLGIESGVAPEEPWWMPKAQNVLKAFTSVFHAANTFGTNREIYEYRRLFALYIRLGEALGFTDEQIEAGYFAKNEVNHQRQAEGY